MFCGTFLKCISMFCGTFLKCILRHFFKVHFAALFTKVRFNVLLHFSQKCILQKCIKEPIHIQDFRFIVISLKQFIQQAIRAKADAIILLQFIAANASHRLYAFFLAHASKVVPNITMTELIIRAVNIIRRRDNHKQFMFLRQLFHDFRIFHTFVRRKDPDAH